jgi:hypothetical protein
MESLGIVEFAIPLTLVGGLAFGIFAGVRALVRRSR